MVKVYQRQIVGVYGTRSWIDIDEEEYHNLKRYSVETLRILYDGDPKWNYYNGY